ncbi:MAG: hypothetical protein M1830_009717 [Pleopsidium flavum]|nr:MAG: hypothetical protein M1830_009717 [Pleopsidium flavum]
MKSWQLNVQFEFNLAFDSTFFNSPNYAYFVACFDLDPTAIPTTTTSMGVDCNGFLEQARREEDVGQWPMDSSHDEGVISLFSRRAAVMDPPPYHGAYCPQLRLAKTSRESGLVGQ